MKFKVKMVFNVQVGAGNDQPGVGVGNNKAYRLILAGKENTDFSQGFALHVIVYAKSLAVLPNPLTNLITISLHHNYAAKLVVIECS